MGMMYLPYIPDDLLLVSLGFGVGYYLSRGGKSFDHDVQRSRWFKNLGGPYRWLVRRLLDVTHHFEYGLIVMYLANQYLSGGVHDFVYSFGFAMVLDDINDIPPRMRRYWKVEK